MTSDPRRLREPTYFILASLLDEPRHGYAIIKHAEELSGGRVRLAAGTLYAALDRLTGEALVRVVDERVVNGRARRYYELTAAGLAALHSEAQRMADSARVVTNRSLRPRAGKPTVAPA
jgi:DNA-binding PadR family transcriptional regulator